MRATPTPLPVTVDRTSRARSLPAQITDQVRALLRAGSLGAGDRLPSTRALATELGVARAVVEQAYDQLHAEGWVASRRGAGTFVDAAAAAGAGQTAAAPPHQRPATPAADLVRLDTGTPWRDPRHEAGWRRAWRDVSVARPPAGYPDPAGMPDLRAEVAAHVARHRGISCELDEVMITAGTTHGLTLLLDTLPAGSVALEDPGYTAAAATVRRLGWRLLDVPVDAEGLDVGALERTRRSDVRAVYVTPAHQHPLGMTLSPTRRVSLLAEARRRDALVVEDDYDSEFRYDVAPLPALAQLDRDRVAYLGTASKTVLPGLRLGWLVTTAERVMEIAARRAAGHDHPSWPVQRAFLSMLRDGYVDRLVRSSRRCYADRFAAVTRRLAPYGRLDGGVAGMYVVLRLPPETADRVVRDARRAGFDLPSLGDYCRGSGLSGIVLGFGGVDDHQLTRALDCVDASLEAAARVRKRPGGEVKLRAGRECVESRV